MRQVDHTLSISDLTWVGTLFDDHSDDQMGHFYFIIHTEEPGAGKLHAGICAGAVG